MGMRIPFNLIRTALLTALLCLLLPSTAWSQDDGRFIVMVDLTGKKARKVKKALNNTLGETAHIVFTQEDFLAAAEAEGIYDSSFWEDTEYLTQVARVEKVDALVVPKMKRKKKRYYIAFEVYNACYGDLVAEFQVKLGKKPKLRSGTKSDIIEQLNESLSQTRCDWEPAPTEVNLTLTSQPPGADIIREGEVLGTTPCTITRPIESTTELWEVVFAGEPAGMIKVNLAEDGEYSVPIPEDLAGDFSSGSDGEPAAKGVAKSVIDINAGVTIASRNLNVSVVQGDELEYGSSMYPVFSLGFEFFPFLLFSPNEYLGGIGLKAGGGYGSLSSNIPLATGTDPAANPDCQITDDPNIISCPTTHTQFDVGATYKLFLQKDGEGKLDADGMALIFDVLYSWLVFDVASNLTYEGHGYQGFNLGAAFSTALGIAPLRLKVGAAYIHGIAFGEANMIQTWGESASGFGFKGELALSYEFFAGLFGELGYTYNYFQTDYGGTGCQNPECSLPTGASASDSFNRIQLFLGYRLH